MSEITMASTSQMLNQKTKWDFELLDQLKLPTNFLVQLWEPGHLVGMVSGAAKKRIRCEKIQFTPLVPLTHPLPQLLEFPL